MFVGFIAVVVILLVIVGLMSSGSTSGSGGVNQTKATKVLTEISALAQSAGFFQTTTEDSDYTGMNIDNLIAAGIVSEDDVVEVDDGVEGPEAIKTIGVTIDRGETGAPVYTTGAEVTGTQLVKSKAVKGLFYNLAVSPITSSSFILRTVVDIVAVPTDLALALESSYAKLDKGGVPLSGKVGDPTRETGDSDEDAAIVSAFK